MRLSDYYPLDIDRCLGNKSLKKLSSNRTCLKILRDFKLTWPETISCKVQCTLVSVKTVYFRMWLLEYSLWKMAQILCLFNHLFVMSWSISHMLMGWFQWCLYSQVLHHIGSSSGDEHGGSSRRTCRNRQDRNHQGYGTMSWEICCSFQLLRPDGLPRTWTDIQR